MTQSDNGDWARSFHRQIGEQIQYMRKRAGLSAEELAEMCSEMAPDFKMTRNIITGIETGKRTTVTVAELVALACALKLPPVALVYPVQTPLHEVEGWPGQAANAYEFINWFNADPWAATYPSGPRVEMDVLGESSRDAWESIRVRREAERTFNMLDGLMFRLEELDQWGDEPSREAITVLRQIDSMLSDLATKYAVLRSHRVEMLALAEEFEVEDHIDRLKGQTFSRWSEEARLAVESIRSTMERIVKEAL